MHMHRTTILDFSPERSFSMSVRIMARLMGGKPVGIHDVDDLAVEVALRFEIARSEGRIVGDPLSFLRGIARNVLREALREKKSQKRTVFTAEIPDMPDEDHQELHPARQEFISRFQESLTPNERSILPDFVWPGGRLRKEIAKQHGKTESALSEAVRRLRAKAEHLRRAMVNETLGDVLVFPTDEAQDRLIALSWTPRERADFRLRLVEVCQSLAATTFKEPSGERDQLVRDAEAHLRIVSRGFAATTPDGGLQGALCTFCAAHLLLPAVGTGAEFSPRVNEAFAALLTGALTAYRSYGDVAGEIAAWQLFVDSARFFELAFDRERLADPHTVRIQRQKRADWFQDFLKYVLGRSQMSSPTAIGYACASRMIDNPLTTRWSSQATSFRTAASSPGPAGLFLGMAVKKTMPLCTL